MSFLLNFIPNWFFPLLAILSIILFFITRFFANLIPQAKIIHYSTIPVFALTLFFMGANWNNNYWQEKLAKETARAEAAAKQQEVANQELKQEREAKLQQLKESAERERQQNKRFIEVLKSKDATVQNVLATLSKAEQDKYAALGEKDKAAANKKLEDVLANAKNCPTVPELYIERLNNTAKGAKQ
jgi:flagellar biosynthesis GTPase FlhF